MEEIIQAILYGTLEVELPRNLTEKEQLEVVRALAVAPRAVSRLKFEGLPTLKNYIRLLKIS